MRSEATFDDLDRQLTFAAESLAATTDAIRALGLAPKKNVRRVAEALTQIYLIQKDIYDRRPDLLPDQLRPP